MFSRSKDKILLNSKNAHLPSIKFNKIKSYNHILQLFLKIRQKLQEFYFRKPKSQLIEPHYF